MQLKDFSLVCPELENNDVLKAVSMAIPSEAIEMAISKTQTQEERKRSLPAQLVVSLVIAMSLWPLRLNAGCTKELDRWFKRGMGESW